MQGVYGIDMSEEIALRFDGGVASSGKLHFYEYTRSQYATARFLSTIEHFRRTGTVSRRITNASYVEILVSTPQQGSFLEVLFVKAQETAAVAVLTPLSSLISLVWETMLPRSQRVDQTVVALAELQLAQERERTLQLSEVRKIVETGNATTQQALNIISAALKSNNQAIADLGLDQHKLTEIQFEIQQEENRQDLIASSRRALEGVPAQNLARLTSRLRPMLPDMALPLKRSASSLSIEAGEDRKPLILLNPRNVQELTEKRLDEKLEHYVVHVKSYDRDRGVGKVTSKIFDRNLNFIVAPSDQDRLKPLILDAMERDTVLFHCNAFRDKSNQITSLFLRDISDSDDIRTALWRA